MIVPTSEIFLPPLPVGAVAWRLLVAILVFGEGYVLAVSLGADAMNLVIAAGRMVGGAIGLAMLGIVVLIFALPLHYLYRRRGWTSPWAFATGASVIAVLILAVPSLLPFDGYLGVDECAAIIDGQRTACGWQLLVESIVASAGQGAGAGVLFQWLLRWRPLARSLDI